jgi:hypothetical protein
MGTINNITLEEFKNIIKNIDKSSNDRTNEILKELCKPNKLTKNIDYKHKISLLK